MREAVGAIIVAAEDEWQRIVKQVLEQMVELVVKLVVPSCACASSCGLAELEQGGWKVQYLEYDQGKRPSRLRMTYPGVDLRLAITQWK